MMTDFDAIDSGEITNLHVRMIRRDGGTQSREEINSTIVAEYAEKYLEGYVFPPCDVFYDGRSYWLVDGFHRVIAALRAKIEQVPCRVRQGTKRDAVLYSCGANATHGLRRTNADKRRSVMRMLNDDDWCKWSDNRIATACGVSPGMVASHRPRSIQDGASGKTRTTVRNGVEYQMVATKARRPAPDVGEIPVAVEVASPTSRDPLREFIKTLKADDVAFRTNVKTDVGMAQVVTDDSVYHVASTFNVASFYEAFGSVTFLRWALKVKRAVIVGPISDELSPYVEAARRNGVGVKPLG